MARRRLRKPPGSPEHVERTAREVESTFRRKRAEAHRTLAEAVRTVHGDRQRARDERGE